MKTYFGVDYHKKFSHGTIMNEKGTKLKQGRFNNNKECIEKFLGDFLGNGCCSVPEAIPSSMRSGCRTLTIATEVSYREASIADACQCL
jgi:hypothetical protein